MPNPKRQNIQVNVNADDINVLIDIDPLKKKINIFEAVIAHDMNGIITYVKAGGDVNVKNKEGYTPLMLAIQNGWSAMDIKKMLDNMPGIDLKLYAFQESHTDKKYGKPIDMAIKANDSALVKVLADYAGTITLSKEITGHFYYSFQAKDEIFKVIASYLNLKNYGNFEHQVVSKLFYSGQLDIIDSLLSQPKYIDEHHQALLLQDAAYNAKNEKIVDLLIDKNFVSKNAIPGVMYCLASQDRESMFKHILSKVADRKPIIDFLNEHQGKNVNHIKYSELLGVEFSDEAGTIYLSDVISNDLIHVDANACDKNGKCIHVGVETIFQQPLPQIVEGYKQNLKPQNARVNVNADDINVLIDIDPQKKKLNIFDAINAHDLNGIITYVKAGGDVNVKNAHGYTPLMHAIQNKWTASEVKNMLDHMPGVDLKLYAFQFWHPDNPKYGTPIDMAVKNNDTALVKVLAEYAGSIRLHKETGGFCHCLKGNNEIFNILLSHVDSKNYTGIEHGTVTYLMTNDQIDAVDFILSQPAFIPEANNYQSSLLASAAVYAKNEKAVDLLIDKKYVGKNAIVSVMYELALKDNETMFKHILTKINDREPIIDFLNEHHERLEKYAKYAEIIGIKDEAGTIYLSDVISNDPIHIDANACNNKGQCIHVAVDTAFQQPLPQIVEVII